MSQARSQVRVPQVHSKPAAASPPQPLAAGSRLLATSSLLVLVALVVLLLSAAGAARAVGPAPGGGGLADPDKPNPVAARQLRHGVMPGVPVKAGRRAGSRTSLRVDKVLTVLVEFAGTDTVGGATYAGPLHDQIPAPAADDNTTYWVADFSPDHYRQMLYGSSPGMRSMHTYYLEQSAGSYSVEGDVYGWVKVPHAEAYYGAGSGARMPELVRDAVQALGQQVRWADYDQDHDGVVDHIQFVHAGAEVAGSWTIWAHSSTLSPAVPTADAGVVVGPYTIQPENGTIGVFCHEFGHSLGLPDLYDTAYTGEASTGYWTLMSSGSWLGAPGEALGTAPPSLGPWERSQLGFVRPVVVTPGQRKKRIKLAVAAGTTGTRAIRIDLPDYPWTFHVTVPHGQAKAWWSDRGDLMTTTLTRDVTLPAGSVLTFWSWWDIEPGYDYGYVEIQRAGSDTWQTVKGSITTDDDPYLANDGNGITGSSGWVAGNAGGSVLASFDLSAFSGPVKLRFRYTTDMATTGDGWTWSDLAISAGGQTVFADTGAASAQGWEANGWRQTAADVPETAENYYVLEWRAPVGSDVGMDSWPNMVTDTRSEPFKALPGMLLWYYTDQFADDWVGVHPWQGMLQVVDARPGRLPVAGTEAAALRDYGVSEGLPGPTRVNLADATFNKGLQASQTVAWKSGQSAGRITIPSGARIAGFDDARSWVDQFWKAHLTWDPTVWPARFTSPDGVLTLSLDSVLTPVRGVRISVVPLKGTGSGGYVTVDYSKPVGVSSGR
jgi:M6 family metalloprotease-like protein